jgi:hypothetical protein
VNFTQEAATIGDRRFDEIVGGLHHVHVIVRVHRRLAPHRRPREISEAVTGGRVYAAIAPKRAEQRSTG